MNSRKKEILKAVALRLKELREHQGCSPVEMASRLGISRGAYNKNFVPVSALGKSEISRKATSSLTIKFISDKIFLGT